MAFCVNCGTQLEDGAKFCTSCGTWVGATADAQPVAEAVVNEIPAAPVADEMSAVSTENEIPASNTTFGELPVSDAVNNEIPNEGTTFGELPQTDASANAFPVGGAMPNYDQQAQPEQPKSKINAVLSDLNNTADTTSEFDPADIEQNKFMAILSYISILVLIPFFAAKESKFARFHVNQGLVLLITTVAWNILSAIIRSLIKISILRWACNLVSIALLALAILGIYNAFKGLAKELPIIGKFKIIK